MYTEEVQSRPSGETAMSRRLRESGPETEAADAGCSRLHRSARYGALSITFNEPREEELFQIWCEDAIQLDGFGPDDARANAAVTNPATADPDREMGE